MAEYSLTEMQNIQPHRILSLEPTLFTLDAGKNIKMETTPDGADLLDETVPAGKMWKITVEINVIEEAA